MATTSVKIHNEAPNKLRELSKKRKAERNPVRTQEDILNQLIDNAHKKECGQ